MFFCTYRPLFPYQLNLSVQCDMFKSSQILFFCNTNSQQLYHDAYQTDDSNPNVHMSKRSATEGGLRHLTKNIPLLVTKTWLSSFCYSPHPWCHDRRWGPETGEAQRTLGDDTRLHGLHRHGCVLLPRCTCQPSRHGLEVPAVPPGPGCATSHPAGAVGIPGGFVPGAAGETPFNRHGVWFCPGLVPLQPDGDGVALIEHLSDSDFHQHPQLEPLFLSFSNDAMQAHEAHFIL